MRNFRVGRTCLAVVLGAILLSTSMVAVADAASARAAKIDPALLAQAKANPTKDFSVIVRANSTKDKSVHRSLRAADAVSRAKGNVGHGLSIVGGTSATLSGAALLTLAVDPDVAYITPDVVLRSNFDPAPGASQVRSPGIITANAPQAWRQLGVTGRGIGVAILDSGIAPHSDLAGRIVASVDLTSGVPGTALVAPADPGGHGTHVAGLVAGDGTASAGAYTGVAPGANLIDVRVIGSTGYATASTVLRGMQWVLANRKTYNIRVVNLSLGAPASISYKQDPLATGVEILTFANVAVVVAGGNSGPADSTITTPGYDPYVITVGALDDNGTTTTSDDSLPSWSSRGATGYDGVAKPDLAAPGRKMVSLRSPGSTLDQLYPDRQVAGTDTANPAYFRLSGTSMAAPIVAGTIALMLERNASLAPAQLKRHLKATAAPVSYGSLNSTGAGMVDALAAVSAADADRDVSSYRVSDGFASDVLPYLQGQTLVWKSLTYNGGVDSRGTPWSSVTWANIAWDSITWEDIAWESFTWTDIAWESLAWTDISWETTTLSMRSLSGGTSSGWSVLN